MNFLTDWLFDQYVYTHKRSVKNFYLFHRNDHYYFTFESFLVLNLLNITVDPWILERSLMV